MTEYERKLAIAEKVRDLAEVAGIGIEPLQAYVQIARDAVAKGLRG